VQTGIAFGLFRDILQLQDQHCTRRLVFAFEKGVPIRKAIHPTYKRRPVTPGPKWGDHDHNNFKDEAREQIALLRDVTLPMIGFQNVFWATGYEADDVIASVCQHLPKGDEAVIVSTDRDFYQLLSPRVSIWEPKKTRLFTHTNLTKELHIAPAQWVDIKAMAGCVSDNVPGVNGIGERLALKYVRGLMDPKTKKYQHIKNSEEAIEFSRKLVRLPYPGTPTFTLREDHIRPGSWRSMMSSLGIKRLEPTGLLFTGE
jgi:DNA polymerase-1